MNKEKLKAVENWLDERFRIALYRDKALGNENGDDFLPSNPDFIYYKCAIDLLECMGYTCERDTHDRHIIYK